MAYYVIIRGPAGVGKSIISKILASKINAGVVNFDKIMEELGLDYIPGDKWIPLAKFLKADEAIVPTLIKKLESGTNIILDGNFYHKEQINDLAKRLDFKHIVFTLKATLKECIKRDKSRGNGLGEQAISDVFRLVSTFDYGIIIDTSNKNPEEISREILANLTTL